MEHFLLLHYLMPFSFFPIDPYYTFIVFAISALKRLGCSNTEGALYVFYFTVLMWGGRVPGWSKCGLPDCSLSGPRHDYVS